MGISILRRRKNAPFPKVLKRRGRLLRLCIEYVLAKEENKTINISIMTHDDPRFYPLLGPYLANRVVAEAYGAKIWDDAADTWAIARTRDGALMGVAALRASN